ncbi:DUF808 domain-containing protein [Smaragdicoccus niigatensis]|uniref:DUF808 domain-containing protein n=1 Tax=Smaragdicoccus niigatensis TaxID=359359 RepID=UPI000363EDFF|nr:DUF808 domain-containing protein [Smaragdicoccus niigatensis]
MAGGLVALLDDVAALARLAAASLDDVGAAASRASVKAAGVVVDDTAVTPRYVHGLAPERELSIIARIARGSLINKLLFILPVAMILSQFAPWALTPLLMMGGVYLCFEGAEKIWEKFEGGHEDETPVTEEGPEAEKTVVSGAIRTDFILSAEIMVIALNEVAHEPFLSRLFILIVVALLITALVYGVVALIVKMDDVGLHLTKRASAFAKKIGSGLVKGMPIVLAVLANVGVIAMLWVGGHILLDGAHKLGLEAPYEAVHHMEHYVAEHVPGVGAVVGWFVNTGASAIVGLVIGAIVVAIMHAVHKIKHKADH